MKNRRRKKGRSEGIRLAWDVIYPVLLYFLMAVIFQGVPVVLYPALADGEYAMWLVAVSDALMIPVFYWMYRKDQRRKMSYTGGVYWYDRPIGKDVGEISVYVTAIVGGIVLSRVFNILIYISPLPDIFTGYNEVSEAMYSGSLLSQILASVVAAPVMEELLMRGVVYGRLREGMKSHTAAVILGALVFGLFHGNVVQGVYAFLMGLFFIWVYDRSESLAAPVLAHMAANGSAILLQWLSDML